MYLKNFKETEYCGNTGVGTIEKFPVSSRLLPEEARFQSQLISYGIFNEQSNVAKIFYKFFGLRL
jgi:hypothetical protein